MTLGKVSKSNQDPRQIHRDHEGIQRILSKKSQHFAMGTGVLLSGLGHGIVAGISKDGGRYLRIKMDDGTYEKVRNPRYNGHWR